ASAYASSPSVVCDDTATSDLYTLSLHDALPISYKRGRRKASSRCFREKGCSFAACARMQASACPAGTCSQRSARASRRARTAARSEEHTSELQSRFDLVCRLLLEKKENSTVKRA